MNFDFSEESKLLREQARRFLTERCSPRIVRSVMEGAAPYDRDLWRAIGEMGWLGTTIPERYDGSELGYEALCVLAEELGRAIAPVPFSSTIFLAAELIMAAGSEEQKRRYLPRIARGELIATFALSEGAGEPNPSAIQTRLADNQLTGVKWPVIDVAAADIAVAAVREPAGISLAVIDLRDDGIARTPLETVDPSRPAGKLDLQNVPAEPLGRSGEGWEIIRRVLDRAAVLTAFEQVGGASGCLEMATAYAKERYAFGRPIGSFQAIKHKLADVYTATELARSNAYYGAWALSAGTTDLALAAATARVSASDAFFTAAKENIHVHGGMGFTWDVDCHLYYRRAKLLALSLGSTRHWKDRMIAELETRNAA